MNLFGFKKEIPPDVPQVHNESPKPAGTVPKDMRIFIGAGILGLMAVMAITKSRHSEKPLVSVEQSALPIPRPQTSASVLDARQRIEVMKKADDRRRELEAVTATPAQQPPNYQQYQQTAPEDPVKAAIRQKEAMRDFESPSMFEGSPSATLQAPTREPDSMEGLQQILAAMPPVQKATEPKPVEPPAKKNDVAEPGEFNAAEGKRYVMFEGTIVETVLLNRLDGEFAGPVNTMTTADVYDHSGTRILIPSGTKILGEAKQVSDQDQRRLAVMFHRMLMPDGYSVSLDKFGALDQQGASALGGKVNHHYFQVFGAAIAVGLLGGLEQSNAGSSLTGAGAYREGLSMQGGQEGQQIMSRFLNRMPVLTVPEGARVKVYFTEDKLLPSYENHRMQGDL